MAKLIGTLVVTNKPRINESFEVAAWYRLHEVQDGEYNVYHSVQSGQSGLNVTLNTEVVDAYLGTLYGGVHIGGYDKTRELGPSSISRSCGFYAYQDVAPFFNLGEFAPLPGIDMPKVGYLTNGIAQFNIVEKVAA